MTQVRLQSLKSEDRGDSFTIGIHTPGVIAWAKAGFSGKKNDPLVRILADSFRLRREVALALLTGEVEYTVEGDSVVFDWPGDDPLKEDE